MWFGICHQIRNWKYGSVISNVSGLALRHSDRNGPAGLVNGSVGTVTSRHHIGHHGGPAIVTSQNGRYLVRYSRTTERYVGSRRRYAVVIRRRSGLSCAGWGCRIERSAADRSYTDTVSRQSECGDAWSTSNYQRTSSCTVDSGTVALLSASADEWWRMSSVRSYGYRPDSGKVFLRCVYVHAPSSWQLVRTTCDTSYKYMAFPQNEFSCGSWECSAARTTYRRYDIHSSSLHRCPASSSQNRLLDWQGRRNQGGHGSQTARHRSVGGETPVRRHRHRTVRWSQAGRSDPPGGTDGGDDGCRSMAAFSHLQLSRWSVQNREHHWLVYRKTVPLCSIRRSCGRRTAAVLQYSWTPVKQRVYSASATSVTTTESDWMSGTFT